MSQQAFYQLIARMAASGIAQRSDIKGCAPDEIAALEHRYGVRLPATYRRYLEAMGHGSGRLFTSDHVAVTYAHVFDLTQDLRARLVSRSTDDAFDVPPPEGFEVPADAIVIASRLVAQWEFIRCSDPNDSPVWFFRDGDWVIRQNHASVGAWLESWCETAEAAIASGYFEQSPRGTRP
jgi:SMI1 / KNR4 family (SUKH-1)